MDTNSLDMGDCLEKLENIFLYVSVTEPLCVTSRNENVLLCIYIGFFFIEILMKYKNEFMIFSKIKKNDV